MKATIELSNRSSEKPEISERRWGVRRPSPRLAVFYWNGGTPKPHGIRDISVSGLYLLTRESLFPGVVLLLTLQREDLEESDPDQWIAVHALVVRRDPDGVALSFVFPKKSATRLKAADLANGATRDEMINFLWKLFKSDDPHEHGTARTSEIHPAAPEPVSIPAPPESSRITTTSRTSKACVCDLTQGCLVSPDVSVIDTVKEPLKTLTDDLSHVSTSALWLTPFPCLPFGNGLARFDVLFLDENYRIAECAEQFDVAESGSFRSKHASALVVPSRTMTSSQLKVGDQLKICTPDSRAIDHAGALYSAALTRKTRALGEKHLHCFRDAPPPLAQAANEREENALPPTGRSPQTNSAQWSNPARKARLFGWFLPGSKLADRRRARRISAPAIIAFHDNAGEPKAHKLADLSSSGFYLLTDERWFPGTRLAITLQKANCAALELADWNRVESEVVRWGLNGVGFRFTMNDTEILQADEFDQKAFQQFLAEVTAGLPGPRASNQ